MKEADTQRAILDYLALRKHFAWRNNSGNCRCSRVGYAPIYGAVKCANNFAVFPTIEQRNWHEMDG
jgi:hypothetical protein